MGFLMSTKGIPSGYNKDLQEDKSAIFRFEYKFENKNKFIFLVRLIR